MLSVLRRKRSSAASPARSQADAALIAKIHETWSTLRSKDDSELRSRAEQLRDATLVRTDRFDEQTLQSVFALTAESIRRSLHIEPFDVQLLAGLALVRGQVAEMQTGEGKTIAAAFPALALSLAGRGVHVVTANAYLARRDCEELRPVFERLGVSCGLIDSEVSPEEKTAAYRCDITYGPGYEFGFDYLRDQIALRAAPESRPGEDFLRILRGQPDPGHATIQRGLPFAVIDEVDNVLIDDASSPLLLSGPGGDTAEDAEVHLAARDLASGLTADIDYRVVASTGQVRLTKAGHSRIWDHEATLPLKQLIRPWHVYVEQALRAKTLFRRDVQYVVREEKVCIVDESTGRIFDERVWRDGLH
jgi:preprotein translocase subunit SecA